MTRTYTIACLAGDGVGPELIAEASRALHSVAQMHAFAVEDVHVPFGSEALVRSGHPLPPATRSAALDADSVLVAALRDPALAAIQSELDLRARVTQVVFSGGGFTLLSPLDEDAAWWTVERAFAVARRSRGRLTSINEGDDWGRLVDEVSGRHDGVDVEHFGLGEGLPALAFSPERFDVIVAGSVASGALEEIAAGLDRDERLAACGLLAGNGPSVFSPADAESAENAGHGVADPASMLLAASLLLREGVGEQGAAETLAAALSAARAGRPEPFAPARRSVAASTRELADAVLGLLPVSHRNAEFLPEAFA